MPVPGSIKIKQLDLELNVGCNFKFHILKMSDVLERVFL